MGPFVWGWTRCNLSPVSLSHTRFCPQLQTIARRTKGITTFTLASQQGYFYISLSHKESSPSSMSLFSYQSCVYSRQSFESGPWLIKCLYVSRRYTKKTQKQCILSLQLVLVCVLLILLYVCKECVYPCGFLYSTHTHTHLCICE